MDTTIGIVIALYNEDSEWIHQITEIANTKVYIYLKNPDRFQKIADEFPTCHVEILENKGRESHTYLFHIVNNYSSLDTYTIFLQGNPFEHVQMYKIMDAINVATTETATTTTTTHFTGLFYSEPFKCDKYGTPHHYLGDNIEITYSGIFNQPPPEELVFYPGAQFMVTKENILQHPQTFYSILMDYSYKNTYIGYALERLWAYIFRSPPSFSPQSVQE